MSCKILSQEFGAERVFRLASNKEIMNSKTEKPKGLLFNGVADYINITQYLRKNPAIHQFEVNSSEELNVFLKDLGNSIIPMFVLFEKNKILPIARQSISSLPESTILFYIIKGEDQETETSNIKEHIQN